MKVKLSGIDDLNRCYLWRILWDQVRLRKMRPDDFIEFVIQHFYGESIEAIIPYILDCVSYVFSMGLLNVPERESAVNSVLDVFFAQMRANKNNKSMVNMILNYWIQLCPEAKSEDLCYMATNDQFPSMIDIKVNKRQRYACLRKLLKNGRSGTKLLFDKEQQRNFSDADHMAKLQYEASETSKESK